MRLIKRDTDYAIRALCFAAQDEERTISASELVKELKIPRPFLRKLLQTLNKKGILVSYKGKGGGFELARPAEDIVIADIIEIFQGPLRVNECLFKKKICNDIRTCLLKRRIDAIKKFIISEFKSITIASLLYPLQKKY